MEAFNAEANVREQREAAYADRYVTLKPKGQLMGLRLEQGGELHHDDGSIVRLLPGDWVVEQPDGRLTACSADVFLRAFEVSGSGVTDVEDQLREARIQAGELKAPTPPAPEPEQTPEDVKAAVLRAHEEANARVAMWAKAAFDADLVTSEERDAMIASNEFPAGLTVSEQDGEWVLTRGEGNEVGSLSGEEDDAGDPPVAWKDQTNAVLKAELQRRQVGFGVTAKKADLIELIEASDADLADGGDGTLNPNLDPPSKDGAETADSAARAPELPGQDPVVADPNPDQVTIDEALADQLPEDSQEPSGHFPPA